MSSDIKRGSGIERGSELGINSMPIVRFKKLRDDAFEPRQLSWKNSDGSGSGVAVERYGMPLFILSSVEDVEIPPLGRLMVHTGMAMALPDGCAGFVIPTKEMALLHGMTFANSPGLVDTGYRGELCLIALNHDAHHVLSIRKGQELGIIAVARTSSCEVELVEGRVLAGKLTDAKAGESSSARELPEPALESARLLQMNDCILRISSIRDGARVPVYAHEMDNGMDLCTVEDIHLEPFERKLVSFGIGISLDGQHMAQIQPRSGLARKLGLSIVDSPSIVTNPSLEEELTAVFINLDPRNSIDISAGERVAQLVVAPIQPMTMVMVDELDSTQRGEDGFGSSGTSAI